VIKLRQIGEGKDDDEGEGDDRYKGTAEALIWRLESVLRHSTIFDDLKHLNLNELFKPGQCTVLKINEVDEKEQQVMVATLLRRLFLARTKTTKKQVSEEDEIYLPYPVFVLIEEAHRFAPAGGDVVSSDFLKTVLSEGRKFGLGVGLISQRPGRLAGDVLSQCNTQFIMRIVNPIDQARVAESIENVGRDLLKELPALTKGQAVIAGEGVNTPVLCRVRSRYTKHGGETMDAPAAWLQYFDAQERARRERETALPISRDDGDVESKLF
jgi:DNA helicase HerA-like ATPase